MKIVVYCGASLGNDSSFKKASEQLGTWIGKNHHTLVYGGGKMGLMGILAEAVFKADGKVIGVIPTFLKEREIASPFLTECLEVDNMSLRKQKMAELGEVFIALPGGPGTLEEISEMISWSRIGKNDAPCILWNEKNYYGALNDFYQTMIENGFYTQRDWDHVLITTNFSELETFITGYTPPKFRSY